MASSSIVSIAIKAQDDASATVNLFGRNWNTVMKDVDKSSGMAITQLSNLQSVLAGIGVGVSFGAFVNFTKDLYESGARIEQLNRAFTAISGTSSGAVSAMAFLRAETNRLGIEFVSSAGAFKGISAAAKDTVLSATQTKQIFSSVAEASSALGLSSEETSGTLESLEQMLSKGKVSAEELRRQMGNRLPGAFQIAAKAMGMTTAELDKALVEGKLYSEDFLPKFAQAIHDKYGKAAANASDMVVAGVNRVKNAWEELKATAYKETGLESALKRELPAVTADINSLSQFMKDLNAVRYTGGYFSQLKYEAEQGKIIWEFITNLMTKSGGSKQWYGRPLGNTGVAEFEQINTDASVESFGKLENAIAKVRDQIKKLATTKQQANFDMAQLLGPDAQSNLNIRPPLETDSDYAKRIADLYGTQKDLSGQVLNIETQRAAKLKEMSELDLNIDMDRYRQLQDEVAALDGTYVIWYEQLQKIQAEMEWTVDARMAKIDQEQQKLGDLENQYRVLFEGIANGVPLDIDVSGALNGLSQVRNMMMDIQGMAIQTYTIQMLMARSPAKEWHVGYSEFLNELQSIPTGSSYTLDVLSRYGISGSGAGDVMTGYASLSNLQNQLSQAYSSLDYYKRTYMSYGGPGSSVMADYYERKIIPAIQQQIQQQQIQLMSAFAGAQSANGGSAGPSNYAESGGVVVNLNINTIEVNAPGAGSGRDFAIGAASALDGELAALWRDKRSSLRAEVERGFSS